MDNLDPSLPGDSSMPADELVSDDSNPTQTDESMPASDEASEEEPRGFFSRLFGRSARETSAAAVSTATTAGQVAMAEEGSLIEAPIEEVAEIDFDTLNSLYSRGMSALAGRNYDEAVGLFRSAAAQGDPLAQYQMATLYYQGLGVNQDYETAALWYRRAAEQGNVDAQYSLGNMYLMGEGIPQNDARARHWYKEAASQGHTSARHNLDNLDRFSESSDLMTKEDISAEITGIDDTLHMDVEDSIRTDGPAFKSEPAVQSNAPASLAAVDYERGLAYSFGEVVPKNMETAFDYFRKAAEKGYAPAQYKLGVAYAYAEGTAEDKKQAIYWYKKAALQGHTIAQRNLGVMYETGDGIPRDKQQALAWYSILADSGNVMDVRRKEQLHSELSMEQLEESERIKNNLLAEISVYMK
jgi:hypothetical protein